MTQTLYERDFYAWTQRQVELLRNEDFADLDLNNLIEEIESMGRSNKREVISRLTRILEHLLKLTYEPNSRAGNHWKRTILTQRIDLAHHLSDNYTLRTQVGDLLDDAYRDARKLAATGLNCSISTLPAVCPWTVAQVLDEDWLPPL